jgi:hypothetical protein
MADNDYKPVNSSGAMKSGTKLHPALYFARLIRFLSCLVYCCVLGLPTVLE